MRRIRPALTLAIAMLPHAAAAGYPCLWHEGRTEEIACEAKEAHNPRLCRGIQDRQTRERCEDDARRRTR